MDVHYPSVYFSIIIHLVKERSRDLNTTYGYVTEITMFSRMNQEKRPRLLTTNCMYKK